MGYWVYVSGFLLFVCSAVYGQTVETTTKSPSSSDELQEIVVTALKERTSVQNTPAAVTVVSGATLEALQIENVQGVQNVVPGVRFTDEGQAERLFIRGVGSLLDYYWIPETTAMNFNGVYVPRFATIGALFDVDSVQVLPGPQGVLYGRSAGGGVVAIDANRPNETASASGSIGYGNYDLIRFEGAGNVPIGDELSLRAALVYNKHDGYQSLGLDADDSSAFRISALYKPTDALSAYVWVTHFEQQGAPEAVQYLPYLPGHNAWYVPAVDPFTGLDNTSGSFENMRYTIAGTELNYDLGSATFQYTAGFLNQTEQGLRKLAGNNQLLDNSQDQYTQNLHVSGKNGPIQWIGGVDWFYADSYYDEAFGPNMYGDIFPELDQRSYSAFAQGTWSFTPVVRLIGGVRDTKDLLALAGNGIACFGTCYYSPVTFDDSWNHVDWKVGTEWDAASNVLVYGNVQTGYAPGTLNTYTDTTTLYKPISPQTLLAYTAGIKSQTPDHTLTANLEGFYYGYKDLIIQAFNSSLGSQSLYNAPRAYVRGLQLASVFLPTGRDTLSINVAWTDGTYGRFAASAGAIDIDGLQMVYTPTWSGNIAFDHRFDLSNGGTVDARIGSYSSSRYWGTFDHTAGAYQGSYHKSDASLVYKAPQSRWSTTVWVKNIENVPVNTTITDSGLASPQPLGSAYLEPPRTFGITFGFSLQP